MNEMVIKPPKKRTDFTKVFVRYIGGRGNRIGFVAEYYTDIADLLIKRGHVEIITNPADQARAKQDIEIAKEKAVEGGKKKKEKEVEEEKSE